MHRPIWSQSFMQFLKCTRKFIIPKHIYDVVWVQLVYTHYIQQNSRWINMILYPVVTLLYYKFYNTFAVIKVAKCIGSMLTLIKNGILIFAETTTLVYSKCMICHYYTGTDGRQVL